MHWLSRSGEEFAVAVAGHGEHDGVDVLVVGSGYGGAVAALRFAQAGRSVTVLERGAEYVAGEFPADISQAGVHIRAEMASTSGVAAMGNEDALFDLRLGLRAGALVGNGLGGTSLINAGVGLRPDPRVFRQDAWPAAIRQDQQLDRWFRIARDELELQKADDPAAGGTGRSIQASPKFQRLKDFAGAADTRLRPLRAKFEAVPIAVEMRDQPPTDLGHRQPCNGCGDCVTGCNHHAKLSLTATYLPRAYRAGASFFTGITVLAVRYDPRAQKDPAASDPHPWVVTWLRTAERRLASDIAGGPASTAPLESTVRAASVVLSAGTFGSTEILLRSRARGLAVSGTALGMRVSGNGDDVSFAYDLTATATAQAVGAGSGPRTAFVGPTITAAVRVDDGEDVRRSTLVEDGGVPGLIGGLFHELTATLATAAQLDRPAMRQSGDDDPLALSPAILARTMPLLGMGHDSGQGVIAYDKASDRVSWAWPEADKEPVAQRHLQRQSAVEDLGAVFLQNPATNVLPRALSAVLSGPAPGGAVFTVHPLGGCRMSDEPYTGVVTDWGGVWRADRAGVFPGLYVLDGSIVPTSLGVNPLLTITALAERACDMILRGAGRAEDFRSLPAAPRRPTPAKAPGAAMETVLTEVLRDRSVHLAGAWAARAARAAGPAAAAPAVDAALFAAMHVPDWQAVLRDPSHQVELVTDEPAGSYRASRLEVQIGEHKEVLLALSPSVVHLFQDVTPDGSQKFRRRLRLAATYLINRWLPDQFKAGRGEPSPARRRVWPRVLALAASRLLRFWLPGAPGGPDFDVAGAWRLLGHANEVREFRYEVKLKSQQDGALYTLHARKVVDAAASAEDLRQWWAHRRASRKQGWWAPVRRRSAWQQLSEADYEVLDGSGACVAHGRLVMDLPDVLRHLPSQLGPGADTLNALLALAGYPLFLLRLLLKTRTLDFRAPDYEPALTATVDPATLAKPQAYFELEDVELPWLQLKDRTVEPEPPIPLDVRLSSHSEETIRIGLLRYKAASRTPATEWDDRWKRTRVKSIVLVNGFAQNTRTFVAPELGDQALASRLWADGWDVWMLEYRVSPLLRASSRFCSMDDIAAYDLPAAVETVRRTVEQECGLPAGSSQIFAFSHCVGSASLAMSILGGQLAKWEKDVEGNQDVAVPHLAGVLFSQFLPFVIGSETAQQRLQFGSFLHNVLRQDMLNFTAGAVKPDLLHAMLDRAFASAAYDKEPESHSHERCPSESDLFLLQPDSTTCKRMTGILSRLFNHDQLHPATHPRLDWYFGRTNLGVFLHGARCVEHERLVNADGQNVYVTDKKIGRYLTMPVMLLHGQDNVLFDQESLLRTGGQLERTMGGEFSRPGPAALYSLGVPGYAHFDCTIGKNAPRDIFGPVVAFFAESFKPGSATAALQPFRAHASTLHRRRCMARVPATGPLVGWTRRKAGPGSPHLLRVWFEVSTDGTDFAAEGVTRLRYATARGEHVVVQRWELEFSESLKQPGRRTDRRKRYLRESRIGYCVADLEVPDEAIGPVSIEALSVHSFAGGQPSPVHESTMAQLELPTWWGVPLEPQEIRKDVGAAAWPAGQRLELLVQPPAQPLQASRPAATRAARRLTAVNVPCVLSLDRRFVDGAGEAGSPPEGRRGEPQDPIPPEGSLMAGAFDALLAGAQAYEEATDTVARRPDPGTLSRKRRELSGLAQACIRWTPPSSQPFGFLAAACRHPGITAMEQDRADLSLLQAAAAAGDARFMALLGDQIYADARAGLFDSASEIERVLPRYRQAFGSPGFRALAARLPLRMILDDHEISDNWSMEELGRAAGRVRLRNALRAYRVFQRSHGPARPGNGSGDAYFDCEGFPFFMLDTRTARWRSGARQRLMRPRQWYDLAAALLAAQQNDPHRPKFILSGSVLAPGLVQGQGAHPARSGDTWQHSPADRHRLLEFLSQQRIGNVVLLSSDYHCSATATVELPCGLLVRAICAPPLHAPLVFANTQPHEVLAFEEIELRSGTARVRTDFVLPGEGWLDCRVEGGAAGGWRLQLDFHLRDMQSTLPDLYQRHSRSYELQARVEESA